MKKRDNPTQCIPNIDPKKCVPSSENAPPPIYLNPDGTIMPTWTMMCIICLKPTIKVQVMNEAVRTICIQCCMNLRKLILIDTDNGGIQYITPRPTLPNK